MRIKFFITILMFNNIFCNVKEQRITNPIIAMGLSAIIPGSGQIYNGNWKKGLAFLGLELISLTQMDKYNKSANSYIQEYEDYADEHWKIERWLQDFYLFKDQDHLDKVLKNQEGDYNDPWFYSHGPKFYFDGNGYTHKTLNDVNEEYPEGYYESVCGTEMTNGGRCDLWMFSSNGYVLDNNSDLPCDPAAESDCNPHYLMPWGTLVFADNDDLQPTSDFSHIYLVKDHHLYEGLGKYNEYFAGWNCSQEEPCDEEATLAEARQIYKNGTWNITNDRKEYYQSLRNKSNEEFDKEELFLSLIFVNHAVSMFDAFLTSLNRTKKVNIESNMKYGNTNGIEIQLKW